jgi:hypothetical protein
VGIRFDGEHGRQGYGRRRRLGHGFVRIVRAVRRLVAVGAVVDGVGSWVLFGAIGQV